MNMRCLTLFSFVVYLCIYSSYDERIQRKQSAQYRKRRAIAVKVPQKLLAVRI